MEGKASVTVDFGYDTDVTSVIATRLLKKMFGTPKKQITKHVKWNAVEGEATITASQVVKTYTFNSKVKTVKVAVYGKVTTGVSIETAQPQEVKTHGGGSN
jgi:molybdopterin-binding protein